ncbi:hypothetical protein K1T35_06725 [Pseudonocardia sp. DSM 110487]|uniref:hypothetical protein n=1 Tax=Pseudonocardia sp. DSM 110487 TaxID=2865833 RepID=UPI001C69F2E9|nr:hypothetical protein [Pseudonocardia sp. DSM 110487]QYN36951.1 hypothetical protein K1T35_06725 [Pseudonocardia sp. DSM 110487]
MQDAAIVSYEGKRNQAAHCDYATLWNEVAAAYPLAVDDADRETIDQLLTTC